MSILTPSQLTAVRVSAASYIALFLLAIFANFFVVEGLVVSDDAAATIAAIKDNELLFRMGLLAFLVIFVIDVVVSWSLYVLFEPISGSQSQLAAWFRIVYSLLLAVGIGFLYLAMQLSVSAVENQELVGLMIAGFEISWMIGLASFGLHLIVIGRLIVASKFAPSWLGILLSIAGVAYIADTALLISLTDYAAVESLMMALVAVPAVIAELSFTIWLGYKAFSKSTSVAS